MNSLILCRLIGAIAVILQAVLLSMSIYTGTNPIEYAYGFSGWGILIAIPCLNVKR